ncbi:MAG: hypothetical protein ACK5MZ_11020 [Aestuariibaculum sp.]
MKVTDKNGHKLWTWDFTWDEQVEAKKTVLGQVDLRETNGNYTISASGTVVKIDKNSGKLVEVKQNGSLISLTNGPKIIMARRGDRTLDGTVNPEFLKGEDRIYKEFACWDEEVNCSENLLNISAQEVQGKIIVEANYHGILQKVVWTIDTSGLIQLDYEYEYNGVVDLAGVYFDYPEEKMKAKKWLGDGPYRVWQNRLKGTTLDIWENDYNDPIPGESFNYPEFKGYFNNWQWAEFTTEEGKIYIENKDTDTYLGVYSPRDGRDALLYTLPDTGIAVLDVIIPARNKVNATDLVGPSSQPKWLNGLQKRTVFLKFGK